MGLFEGIRSFFNTRRLIIFILVALLVIGLIVCICYLCKYCAKNKVEKFIIYGSTKDSTIDGIDISPEASYIESYITTSLTGGTDGYYK